MDIRIDLNTPIHNGKELVFRSPVDCSQVTGLKVYSNGERNEFAFADAHGKNLGDIDHLFAKNGVVKVILDVTSGMAYVQNADTNSYLESRFSELEKAISYVPIDITTIENNVGTIEMGRTVDSVTLSWAINKEPVSQTINGKAVDASARSTVVPGPFTEYTKFTLNVTDEKDATDSEFTEIIFLNGVYYGAVNTDAQIENISAAILSLTRKLQSSKGLTFTVDAGENERIVYALPTRYGTPTFTVGGFVGGFVWATETSFTNASGYTESYNIWVSENTGLGNTTVKVS